MILYYLILHEPRAPEVSPRRRGTPGRAGAPGDSGRTADLSTGELLFSYYSVIVQLLSHIYIYIYIYIAMIIDVLFQGEPLV